MTRPRLLVPACDAVAGSDAVPAPEAASEREPRASVGLRPVRVAVVVLGDLGRSPRMQYHALALAEEGAEVDLVGYAERPVDAEVAAHPRIQIHALPPSSRLRQRVPAALFVPVAAAEMLQQAGALFALLALTLPRPDYLLCQNPPAFPTLLVARLLGRLRGVKVVIDWHNFGADVLALRLGREHLLVRAARFVERVAARGAHAHLCVSEQMRQVLAARWGVSTARVLRDRPAKAVGRTPLPACERLFRRLGLSADLDALGGAGARPALIVTSSSWTADEDFGLLVQAMRVCDRLLRARPRLPPLLFLLTGDGPLRGLWEQRLGALAFARVRARILWVPSEDYPRLLGAAEVGVSLHRSASGVDLPMKIADMFGAGLPVCALDYGPVLSELVRPHQNGLLFRDAEELGQKLCSLVDGFPEETPALDELRRGVARLAQEGWAEGWRREARPVFQPQAALGRSHD